MLALILLFRVQWLSIQNGIRTMAPDRVWGAVLVFWVLGMGLWAAVLGLIGVMRSVEPGDEARVVHQLYYLYFLFMLTSALPHAVGSFLMSRDYELLMTLPLRSSDVIRAKLLQSSLGNVAQLAPIILAGVCAVAVYYRLSLAEWPVMVLSILPFLVIPGLLVAALVVLIWLRFGSGSVRKISLMGSLVLGGLVMWEVASRFTGLQLSYRPGSGFESAVWRVPQPASYTYWLPSGWSAESVVALASGNTQLAWSGVAMSWAMLAVCWLLVSVFVVRAFRKTGFFAGADRIAAVAVGTGRGRALSPFWGLARKDLTAMWRDDVLIGQLLMPLYLIVVPLVMRQRIDPQNTDQIFFFSSAIMVAVLYIQNSIISLSSIGFEGRAFWLIRTSPLDLRRVLWSKALTASIYTTVTCCIPWSTFSLLFRWSVYEWLGGLAVIVWGCISLCACGVGLSAVFPRYVVENTGQRVSPSALLAGFMVYSVLTILAVGLGFLIAIGWYRGVGHAVVALEGLFLLAIGPLVGALCIGWGVQRLASDDWRF